MKRVELESQFKKIQTKPFPTMKEMLNLRYCVCGSTDFKKIFLSNYTILLLECKQCHRVVGLDQLGDNEQTHKKT